MSCDILYNEAALQSLKRQQLVQLCKKYGLRASGKNVDLISRLQEHGSSLTAEQRKAAEERLDSDQNLDEASQTCSDSSSSSSEDENVRTDCSEKAPHEFHRSRPSLRDNHGPRHVPASRPDSERTDSWEVLKGDISTDHESASLEQIEQSGSVASWKSARNGGSRHVEPVDITPNALSRSRSIKSRVGTIKSVGSSLNLRLRNASSSSLGSLKRKASGRTMLDKSHMSTITSAQDLAHQEEDFSPQIWEQEEPQPSIGIPTRHGHMLGSRAPSTMRMVSSNRKLEDNTSAARQAQVVQTSNPQLVRDAMPIEASPKLKPVLTPFCKYPLKGSPSTKRQLPSIPAGPPQPIGHVPIKDSPEQPSPMDTEEEDDRPIPGAFPTPPSKRKEAFVFGSNSGVRGISNDEFGIAGDAVLEEMNRKLKARGIASIGQTLNKEEVLQQKARSALSSGYASKSKDGSKGRFDAAHAKQFARMPSIASGLTDGRTRLLTRKAVSTSRLLDTAGDSTNAGQVTPGKRKASDLDLKANNDTSCPGQDHISSIGRNSFSLQEAEMEESPRVKRMRLAPRDGYRKEMAVDSAGKAQVHVAIADRPKSKLGFLTASANSLKSTVSALQRTLSNAPDMSLQSSTAPRPQSLLKPRSHLGLAAMSEPNSASTSQSKETKSQSGFRVLNANGLETRTSYEKSTHQPVTGLSMAYDIHVRRSKSSLALNMASRALRDTATVTVTPLSTSQSVALGGTLGRPGFSSSNSLGYEYRRTGRPAPPAPTSSSASQLDTLRSHPASSTSASRNVTAGTLRPLPHPPVGIPRSQSSSLLRPTASSLARMQATVQPPSLVTSTPKASAANGYQRTPFKSSLVPKSPHRRAMERHALGGRSSGMTSATGGFKSQTSHASLAMSQKQREIEERRRARAHTDMPLY